MKKLLTICFITLTATVFANTTKTDFKNTSTPGFLENKGQIADDKGNLRSDILFTTQSQGVKVFIGKQGLHYQFSKVDNPEALETIHKQMENPSMDELPEIKQTVYRLDVELVGANANPIVIKENATGYFENYYLAHCPDGITGVKSFGKVILKDVYQGIDWVFYRKGDFMKYDFIVHPGADASQIKLQFKGAENLALNEDGSFTVKTPLGTITEEAPISFIQKDQQKVESSFILNENVLSFNVTNTPNQTLVIDPTLIWATYYGGAGYDEANTCSTDINNNVYLSGRTSSASFITSGGYQNTFGGDYDAFLVKFNSAGVRQWATYYGGTGWEQQYSCVTDVSGNIYITGFTTSTTAIASGGHQNTIGGGYDAFLVKFNSSGTRQWATYYGGTGTDRGWYCVTDVNGNIYLSGYTESLTAISLGGHQNSYGGGSDAFLVKFNSTGVRQWATYYGGTTIDSGQFCCIDDNDNIYLTGFTASTTGIASGGHQNSYGGGTYDAFLVKFNSAGVRQWASYYGGNTGVEYGTSCNADANGNIYLTGFTPSTSGISSGGHQNSYGGGTYDAFLVKFNSAGVRQWATYYGGSDRDQGTSSSIDINGNIYIAGHSASTSGIASGGYQNIYGGGTFDAFLVKFNSAGVRQWASYYGGTSNEYGRSCASSLSGQVYLAGQTESTTGIAIGGHQNSHGGGTADGFLVKFAGSICTETTNTINPTECNTYIVPSGDETYTLGGIYMDTIPNVGGCDSVLTINLTINNSTTGTDVISVCGSHTWIDGNFYTSSNNTATHTLTNSVGCDSVVTLNLTILSLSGNTINVSACDSYTVPSGDETYTVSGNYLDTLVNSMGCDSALLINLTVTNSSAGSESVTACDSYTWSANTTTYTTSGSYVATLTNSVGCDSTATLNLTINNSTSGSENVTACDSYIWSANTTTYTTSGSYTATLVNSVGCDSTATLNLTINNSNSGSENATACDSYTWSANGTNYTASGNYTATLTNVNGCDSVVTLNLTINPLPTITTSSDTLICIGQSTMLTTSGASTYSWDNGAGTGVSVSVSPTTTTIYTVTGTDANGCENTASTTVTVDPCLGLEEATNELGINIYPNPSTGEFTIEVKTNCEVEIVNAIGEIVFKQNLFSGANAINISTNPNGLYFINIKTKDAAYSKRVVLSK